MSNWAKTTLIAAVLLVAMLNPMVRSIVILILPLGSGIDDLIFVILAFAVFTLLLMKLLTAKNPIRRIAEWFLK